MRYRKLPVVIDAIRVADIRTALDESPRVSPLPDWVEEGLAIGDVVLRADSCLVIFTPNGLVIAHQDEWLLQGVGGELYPCKDDIFAKTYEAVDDPDN